MHRIQKQLIDHISNNPDLGKLSLRKIAALIGAEDKPQTAKYHLQQLEEKGFIQMNLNEGVIKLVKKGYNKASRGPIYSLPVVGSANCGPATIYAEENVLTYLKVSSSLLPYNKKGVYALLAEGNSMNKAEVGDTGKTIENGDFVLVDSEWRSYKDGDIVVVIIDGMACIKRYRYDKANNRIVLEADSTGKYFPAFIHEGDDFLISGKVVGIIKG